MSYTIPTIFSCCRDIYILLLRFHLFSVPFFCLPTCSSLRIVGVYFLVFTCTCTPILLYCKPATNNSRVTQPPSSPFFPAVNRSKSRQNRQNRRKGTSKNTLHQTKKASKGTQLSKEIENAGNGWKEPRGGRTKRVAVNRDYLHVVERARRKAAGLSKFGSRPSRRFKEQTTRREY